MKSVKQLWIAAAAILLAISAQSALAAIGTIVGSKHDFSSGGPNAAYKGTGTQVCVYCHSPHASSSVGQLWNHAASTATYTLYSSSTLNAAPGQPTGVSKLCLSCHDGTVAIDSFGTVTGTKLVTGAANIGTDLGASHPIGFVYDAALVTLDPGLKAITSAVTIGAATAGTIASKMLDKDGKVACTSCHDVHNTEIATAVEAKLLKVSTSASALCKSCHVK
ncbi:MAG: cytochrome C [Betaproteobacteria bacterium]|nr:cytochrome C [Betaproteobacteria bacterium]